MPTTPEPPAELTDGVVVLAALPGGSDEAAFTIERDGVVVGGCTVRRGDGRIGWHLGPGADGRGSATRAVRVMVDWALTAAALGGLGLTRVEARVDPSDDRSLRVATRAGLRREGVRRDVAGDGDGDGVVLARLVSDPPLSDPAGFRALLNSFLPRKRVIAQLLVRDDAGRVLACHLTYKKDWDLPGGVVEVGESPRTAAGREIAEELGLEITPGALLLADWLPPWGGWDDAVCLVFDGGVHPAAILHAMVREEREIRDAAFLAPEEFRGRAADYTARRLDAALAALRGEGPVFTESGR